MFRVELTFFRGGNFFKVAFGFRADLLYPRTLPEIIQFETYPR